jgi:purine-binding chemotaxis protein CheW
MSQNTLENRYMEFILGDQQFALPLISVKEVIQKPEITNVPNMPSHFEGMMNLRGKIIGVFNVRKKMSIKAQESKTEKSPDVVIVVEKDGISVGMIVDEVTRVIHATADMISAAPVKEGDSTLKYILNVIQTKGDMVLSIDVNELLEIEKYRKKIAS